MAPEAQLLAIQAVKVIAHRFQDGPPHIEQVQDVVEQVLISANHFATRAPISSIASSGRAFAPTARR